MKNSIRFFNTISASNINEVGGKGANLGELTRAGFNVPDGFCVTTLAYSAFILPKQKQLFRLLENLNPEDLPTLRKAGGKARKLLGTLPLPTSLRTPLIEAWKECGEYGAYAVRSSATAEDLPQASFAGQQDTYLNIIGEENLLKSVKNCFISLFTDRAILYRVQNGFEHADVQLSVVVQKMVLPQASGIMFTADPVNGNRSLISIDASFGIGEALVSGLVSADLYQVEKASGTIIKKQIGDKQIAIIAVEGGGTETIKLGGEERNQTTLDDEQIRTLAKLGQKIEQHYGKPQDIEWALVDGAFFVTQSRPITSLYPLADNTLDPEKLYISFNHFQVMTDAMPPLSMSLFQTIFPIGRDEKTQLTRYVVPAGGRLYGEISNILSHPIAGKIFPKLLDRADHLVGKMVVEWQRQNPNPTQKSKIKASVLIPIVLKGMLEIQPRLWWQKYVHFPAEMSAFMDIYVAKIHGEIEQAKSTEEALVVTMTALQNLIHTIEPWRAHLPASMIAMKLLDILIKNRVDSSVQDALMRGLEGNVTTEMDLAVGDLADLARPSKRLIACLSDTALDCQTKLSRAAKLPSGKEFITGWNSFMEKYGARGPSEIDLYRPRWREDGSSLMTMVAGMLKSGETSAHREHYQGLIEANKIAHGAIIEAAGGGAFGWLRKPVVKRLVYVICELFPLREHHKFLLVRLLDQTKYVIEDAGKELQSQGGINNADDVWFMTMPELHDCLHNKTGIDSAEIDSRKQQFEHYKSMTPPRAMTGEGEVLSAQYDAGNAPDGALLGSPVSAGIIEGIAKVVLDPSNETLHPGEILIAPFTDPGWTPLFVNSAGLVTEVGGLMTHGSVIAREYGIPAVVGVIDATKLIKTGQRIRVHGEAGYVEILDADEGMAS